MISNLYNMDRIGCTSGFKALGMHFSNRLNMDSHVKAIQKDEILLQTWHERAHLMDSKELAWKILDFKEPKEKWVKGPYTRPYKGPKLTQLPIIITQRNPIIFTSYG